MPILTPTCTARALPHRARPHQVPEIEIVDSIPKNPVGKLDKPRLRARFTN